MLNVFKISRMTIHNGPGIRTLIHFKGCPLRCIWCSTPESQESDFELGYRQAKCISCGACEERCEKHAIRKTADGTIQIDRDKCNTCFLCAEECYSEALQKIGTPWTAEALADEILKDELFFKNSGGGVTFSGGEPLMYMNEEMTALYKELHLREVSIGVDTTGCVPYEHVEQILPYVDFFLWDLKQMHTELHKKYTGQGNERILENLRRADQAADSYGTKFYIRCPLIPGMTDDEAHIQKVCEFVKTLGHAEEIDLLPFHQLGRERYEFCGKTYALAATPLLPTESIEKKKQLVESYKIPCKIIG